MSNKVLSVLLIEDDKIECENFEKYINTRNDIKLSAVTDSDIEGIELIKKFKPDAIILDLELHNGSGNANSFGLIEALNKMDFEKRPKVIVNTVVSSNTIYDYLHSNGVDLIIYKNQKNYSVENVVDTLVLICSYGDKKSFVPLSSNSTVTANNDSSANLTAEKISDLISNELNLIGVSHHLQGRKYLHDAIYYLVTDENSSGKISAVQFLVGKYKRASSTISRDMQNAILHAWRFSSLEDLETHYTARINYETGVPTPTEFIYYYADKVRKMLD